MAERESFEEIQRRLALQRDLMAQEGERSRSISQRRIEEQIEGPLRTEGGGIEELRMPGVRFGAARVHLPTAKLAEKLTATFGAEGVRTFENENGDLDIAIRVPGEDEFVLLDSRDKFTLSDLAEIPALFSNAETALSTIAAVFSGAAKRTPAGAAASVAIQAAAKTKWAKAATRALQIGKAGGTIGAGAAGGRAIDLAFETGIDPYDLAFSAGLSFGAGAAGSAAADVVGLAMHRAAQKGARAAGFGSPLEPAEREAFEGGVDLARKADTELPLTFAEFTPGGIRREKLAGLLGVKAERRRLGKLSVIPKAFERLKTEAGDVEQLTNVELEKVADSMRQEIRAIVDGVADGSTTLEQGGRALGQVQPEFNRLWKNVLLKRRYDRVNLLAEGMAWDARGAVEVADEYLKGVRVAGAKGAKEGTIIRRFDELEPQIVGAEPTESVQGRTFHPRLKAIAEKMLGLKGKGLVQAEEGSEAFSFIKEVRSELFELKETKIEGVGKAEQHWAGRLYDQLRFAMETPGRIVDDEFIPSPGTPQFQSALKSANAAYRTFEEIQRVSGILDVAALSRKEPGLLVSTLVQPGRSKSLRILKRLTTKGGLEEGQEAASRTGLPVLTRKEGLAYWDRFRQAAINDFAAKPEQIGSRLDAFRADPESLRLIISSTEEAALRAFGRANKLFDNHVIQAALKRVTTAAEKIELTFNDGTAGELAQIVEKAGGKNSTIGRAYAAGMFDYIASKSTKMVKNQRVWDGDAYIALVDKMDKNGWLDAVLQPSQKEWLQKARATSGFLPRAGADAGPSIIASETDLKLARSANPLAWLLGPVRTGRGLLSAVSDKTTFALWSWIHSSPSLSRFALGFAEMPPYPDSGMTMRALRAATAVGTETAIDLGKWEQHLRAEEDEE